MSPTQTLKSFQSSCSTSMNHRYVCVYAYTLCMYCMCVPSHAGTSVILVAKVSFRYHISRNAFNYRKLFSRCNNYNLYINSLRNSFCRPRLDKGRPFESSWNRSLCSWCVCVCVCVSSLISLSLSLTGRGLCSGVQKQSLPRRGGHHAQGKSLVDWYP